MGHNKYQMTWNMENHKAVLRRMGVSVEEWSDLASLHFAISTPRDQMDHAMRNFHADLHDLKNCTK